MGKKKRCVPKWDEIKQKVKNKTFTIEDLDDESLGLSLNENYDFSEGKDNKRHYAIGWNKKDKHWKIVFSGSKEHSVPKFSKSKKGLDFTAAKRLVFDHINECFTDKHDKASVKKEKTKVKEEKKAAQVCVFSRI